MKICFPVENDKGLDSKIFDHFGSAPYFLIYDISSNKVEIINNHNYAHEHEMCDPVAALGRSRVDAVICLGMGLRAINKLGDAGIKVYRSDADTIAEALKEFQGGKLAELSIDESCRQHGCH